MDRHVHRTAVVLLVILAACGTGSADRRPAPRGAAAGAFRPLAPEVYEPCGLQGAGEAVWVLGCSGALVRLPRIGSAGTTPTVPGDIVALDGLAGGDDGAIWALLANGSGKARRGSLARIDAVSGAVRETVALGASIASDALVVERTLWVASADGSLFAIARGTARRAAAGPPLLRVLADGGRMWTVAENGDVVERSSSGGPAHTFSGVMPDAIGAAAGLGQVWLASAARGIVRLDVATGHVRRVGVTGTINAIESCGGSVWISQPDAGVRALDASGRVVRSVELSVASHYLACVGDRLVIVSEDGKVGSITASA